MNLGILRRKYNNYGQILAAVDAAVTIEATRGQHAGHLNHMQVAQRRICNVFLNRSSISFVKPSRIQ